MQRTRSTAVARALGGACRASSHAAVQRRSMSQALLCVRQQQQGQHQQHRQQLHRSQRAPRVSSVSPGVSSRRHGSSSSSDASGELRKTTLYDFHVARGAKMVPFGGFYMPVQYDDLSVSQSHLFTRAHASLFDVGHMVQRVFRGPGAARFLERITPAAVSALPAYRSTLSAILKEDGSGGIVDDAIISRLGDGTYYVVTNAGCRDKDNAYLDREVARWNAELAPRGLEVTEERLDRGLIALQGPEAAAVLSPLVLGADEDGGALDLRGLLFGQLARARLRLPHKDGAAARSSPVLISRGGYTGEDGFEISVAADEAADVAEALLAAGGPERARLAGLGARDSLRLEAGMCLYGHDIDEATTPVEAGLAWIVPKERRGADAGYYGAEVIARQLVPASKGGQGVARRRVGLLVQGAPAREGADIVVRGGGGGGEEKVGVVTSGCPSPSLGKNIAMGYVKEGLHKVGTEVEVLVRGRPRKAVVAKMPFVPTKYWKGE
ncbi:hypothetical protein VTJ83DRAFT_2033 [Remersonia thermophila]|uniref:Aminomethyltransferase n=1 Tax=Remersonia thermophila TaxID=72144 RepID=A0ABR4DJV6_9PEZI